MTKLFLAASVAVLAISAPAAAKPGDRAERQGAASARESGQRVDRSAQRAQRVDRSAQRTQRVDRSAQRNQRMNVAERRIDRPARAETRVAERREVRANRIERAQPRLNERRALRANRVEQARPRLAERQQMRADRRTDVQGRIAERRDLRDQRVDRRIARSGFEPRFANANGRGLINGCPPGLYAKANGCLPPGQAKKLIGAPLATAAGFSALNSFPSSVSYLYPDTDNYYYRYGAGNAYRIDRGSNLISALIPLIAGGYYPGQYLPNNYMNNYMPASYGFNSFYQDSRYDCNRYVNGVVYRVDCVTGMIKGVVPLYAGGYGVGQMLPSAYYNVPYGYRDLYSDSSDYGYHYAPGAIYQYDRRSSLITSVAALLSPGFGIGQQMPYGYGAYNVPYGYRNTYYDTPNSWYRYNNGNIYQVDPRTQLVTAIVASILT